MGQLHHQQQMHVQQVTARQCPLAIPAAHPSHLRFSRVRSLIYHLRPLRFHLQKSPQLCQFKRNSILLTAAHSLFLFFFFLFFPRFFLFFFFLNLFSISPDCFVIVSF